MANYASAYGAIGGGDALRQILTDKILAAKVDEDNRRAHAAEAANAAERAQRGDESRAAQSFHMAQFEGTRDERYQDRLADVARQNADLANRAAEHANAQKQHESDVAERAAEAERARAFEGDQNRQSRALQAHIAGMRAGPDAEGRALAHQLTELKIEAERGKQDTAAATKATAAATKKAERDGFVSLATAVRNHPDLAANVGAFDSMLPTMRAGSKDFEAKRDQLVAALSLESRAKLKGSGAISDYEAKTLERAGTSLTSASDEKAFRAELDRLITEMGPKVTLIAPDGSRQEVPAGQADHFVKLGAKVVQ